MHIANDTSHPNLSDEQRLALSQLPSHRDPFFAVHQALHAIRAPFVGEQNLPLSPFAVKKQCGVFSEAAALSLRRLFHIPREDLYEVDLCRAIHGVPAQQVLQRNLPRLSDGMHTILYIRNGLRFLPGGLKGDIFFDSTVRQFTNNTERTERPLEYLQGRGIEGRLMAERLENRGYVKIPEGPERQQRLGILLAAYYSKNSWLESPPPVNPLSLQDEGQEAESFWGYYDRTVPNDPHRNHEWNFDLFFPCLKPYGELDLGHSDQTLQYDPNWHKGSL